MRIKAILTVTVTLIGVASIAQNIGINSSGAAAHSSAMLDISSSNKGLLIPRVALTGTSDITTIASAATSLLVYNTATVSDVIEGYYYWSGTVWIPWISASAPPSSWNLLGNASTVSTTNFLGTTDNIDLTFRTNNTERLRIKNQTLEFLNSGRSVYIGEGAGTSITLPTNRNNVAIGYNALNLGTTASSAVAIGTEALKNFNGSGFSAVAVGNYSQYSNPSVTSNTSLGNYSLYSNNSGTGGNTAVGDSAMYANTSGTGNVAFGTGCMSQGTAPISNMAFGNHALKYVSGATGSNIAIGSSAGYAITSGIRNIAIGSRALHQNTIANYNIAIGYEAGYTLNTGSNLFLGDQAGYSVAGSGNVCIGYNAGYSETGSNKLYIENSNATTPLIYGDFSTNRVGINCNAPGATLHVGGDIRASTAITTAALACSDVRYKKDICPLDDPLFNISKIRGVSYFWKTDEFPDWHFTSEKQIGFIAQEIEKIYPELVQTDQQGYLAVDYSKLAPVLTEAIKAQQKIIDQQQLDIQNMQKQIEEQKNTIINQRLRIENINKIIDALLSANIKIADSTALGR